MQTSPPTDATAPPAKPLTDQHRPAGRFSRKRDDLELGLANLTASNQAILDRLVGLESLSHAVNNLVGLPRERVLWSGSAQINAGGFWSWNAKTRARSIFVINFSTSTAITVVAGGPAGAAPGPGVGVHNLPAGAAAVFNDATMDWTIYGSAGNVVDVQVFSVPLPPVAAGQI